MLKYIKDHPVIIILIFASILRFWGIWHGYPFSYYPDEQHFVNRAVSFGSGDLNPHWFHKPALLMYILFFEYGLFFVAGKIIGVFPNAEAFAVSYFNNPWPFVLIGRITVTFFGLATVYIVYKIGEKLWDKRVGIYSSVIIALCYGHIFSGQDVKADIPATFFTVLSAYYLLKIINPFPSPSMGEGQGGSVFDTRNYILAGLFAGLGTATKYYSIALLPCILIASVYEIINKKNIKPIAKYIYSIVAFWGIYFIASPYNFIDPLGRRATFGDIVKLFNKISPFDLNLYLPLKGASDFLVEKHQGNDIFNSLMNYLKVLVSTEGVGFIFGSLFIMSLCYLVFKKHSIKKILLLSFPLLFALISIVMNPSYTEPRHQLIIYPFLAIASGITVFEFSNRLIKYKNVFFCFIFLFCGIPLLSIMKNNLHISKSDTRTVAKEWIEANIPLNTKIMLDELSPVLRMSRKNLEGFYEKSKRIEPGQFTTHLEKYYYYQIQAATGTTYDIQEIRHIWWRNEEVVAGETEANTEFDKDMANPIKEVGLRSYDSYMKSGYKYVITTPLAYGSYVKPNAGKGRRFPSYRKFYLDLLSNAKLVKEINHKVLNLPGPTIEIFKFI